METISIILIFIMLASPLLLITALIKPSILWQKNRLHACGSYVVFVFFVMTGSILAHMMVPLTEQQIAERSIAKQEQIEQQEQAKQDEIARQEQVKRDEIAKQEQAKQDEKIKDLRYTSINEYTEKTRAQRIVYLRDLIKYADELPENKAPAFKNMQEKYGDLNNAVMSNLYNVVNRKIALIPYDFNLRNLYDITTSACAILLAIQPPPETRNFDAILENKWRIERTMKQYVKSQMNDPDSFEFVSFDKRLSGNVITYTMTYRGRNAYNGLMTEQLPVNVSIATGMIVE